MSTNIVIESFYVPDNSSKIILDKDNISKNKEKKVDENNTVLKKQNYDLTEFESIIGRHVNEADIVKELKNLLIISLGSDNNLIFYDKNLKKIDEKNIRKWVYSISEVEQNSKTEKLDNYKLLCCTKDEIKCLSNNKFGIVIKDTFKVDCYICLTYQEDSIICHDKGISIKNHLLSKIKFDEKPNMGCGPQKYPGPMNFHIPEPDEDPYIYHHRFDPFPHGPSHYPPHNRKFPPYQNINRYMEYEMRHRHFHDMEYKKNKEKIIEGVVFKSGIMINEKIFAFASNAIDIKGENRLILYSRNKRMIIYEVKNYSFSLTQNCLCSIPSSEKDLDHILLLCACKKYSRGQKNGILLIKADIEDSKFKNIFYDTGNFEVFCFCPILIVTKTEYIFKNDREITNTNYFLAGGFDKNKGKGVIKLYKIIYNENFLDTTIEYFQDINPLNKDKIKGFNCAISCIIQSKYLGNLIVSCWDGNIYSLSPPKMDWFLFYDKKE